MTKRELYGKYGIKAGIFQNPFAYGIAILVILAIDFFTSKITIDGIFSSSEENLNLLITISLCIVLDVIPTGFAASLNDLKIKTRKSIAFGLMIAGFTVVLITLIFMGIERCLTADLLFGNAVLTDINSFSENSAEPKPYQLVIVIILTLVNLGTSVFSVLITLHRSEVQTQIDHALNCEALADCRAALFELEQPCPFLYENLEKEYHTLVQEIKLIAEEAKAASELEIALNFDARTVTNASRIEEE